VNSMEDNICLACEKKQERMFSYRKYNYYKCMNCSFVSTLPLPSNYQIRKHYDAKFRKGNYKLLLGSRDDYRSVYVDFVDRLEKYRKYHKINKSSGSILDIGCFTGDLLEIMKERGYSVQGVELQKKAVDIANKKLDGKVKRIDVMKAKFPGKFDVVIMTGLVEHLLHPVKLMERVSRFVKSGGVVFIQTPNSGSVLEKVLGRYWPPYEPVEHIHLFSKTSLILVLEKLGFTDIKIEKHFKKLPVSYVFQNMKNFGSEIFNIIRPIGNVVKNINISFPFYVGEMVVMARKK